MDRCPKDKTIVITGGAGGIGYEIAYSFLEREAKYVIILDINEDKGLESTHALLSKFGDSKAVFIQCDVTKDLETVSDKIFQEHSVDILVSTARVVDESSVRRALTTNALSVIKWSVEFRERMRPSNGGKGGTIINISSKEAIQTNPNLLFYTASQHSVFNFSQSLGERENNKYSGVSVITICPGYYSKMTRGIQTLSEHDEKYEDVVEKLPSQTAKIVARAVVTIYESADSGSAWIIEGGKYEQYSPYEY